MKYAEFIGGIGKIKVIGVFLYRGTLEKQDQERIFMVTAEVQGLSKRRDRRRIGTRLFHVVSWRRTLGMRLDGMHDKLRVYDMVSRDNQLFTYQRRGLLKRLDDFAKNEFKIFYKR